MELCLFDCTYVCVPNHSFVVVVVALICEKVFPSKRLNLNGIFFSVVQSVCEPEVTSKIAANSDRSGTPQCVLLQNREVANEEKIR